MSTPFIAINTAELTWQDGNPLSSQFDDVYFSKAGALDEARHVYIEGNRLPQRWQQLAGLTEKHFVIAETGFGTSLNFILTWHLWKQYAPDNAKLFYFSCEKYPLSRNDLKQCLQLWPQLKQEAQALLQQYPVLTPGFHYQQWEQDRVHLILLLGDAQDLLSELLCCGDGVLESKIRPFFVDAWFLDGFSVAKNPKLWDKALIDTLARLSTEGTTIASYTVADTAKQALTEAGFSLKKTPCFGLERDSLTGELTAINPHFNKGKRSTPWHVHKPFVAKTKTALIIGAGLAGCFNAHALARRGWHVTLLEKADGIASGASANPQTVLFPQLSAFRSPLNVFMLQSYLYAQDCYRQLMLKRCFGDLSGSLQLAYNKKQATILSSLQPWLAHYPELGVLVDAQQASQLAGIPLTMGGVFFPASGWINSPQLCQYLIKSMPINYVANAAISCLNYEGDTWYAGEHEGQVVVIATGFSANQFQQTAYLPLKQIRGQMTVIASNESSAKIKIPLCASGHVLPGFQGTHYLGATYQSGITDVHCTEQDDLENLKKLDVISDSLPWSKQIIDSWAGIRAATPDYLPLVGAVAEEKGFKHLYQGLATNAKRWVAETSKVYPGLYLCAGFGSRGVTTIPLCAEWLAAIINNEPSFLPRAMEQSLAPARFLRKQIIVP